MKTCLVVDDSRVIRKVARRILEEMSFQVNEAEDGLVALKKCQQTIHQQNPHLPSENP